MGPLFLPHLWNHAFCGTHAGAVHGVTLGSVDGDPGIQIDMHIFVNSKAAWDHIGGDAPQYPESPTRDSGAGAGGTIT